MDGLIGLLIPGAVGWALAVLALVVLGPLTPTFRAQKERLGSAREVRRFRRAWRSGTVPRDADRALWLAELAHWPPSPRSSPRTLGAGPIVLGVLAVVIVTVALVSGGDAGAVLVSALPLVLLAALWAVVARFLPDRGVAEARVTERLRERLGGNP